MTESGVGDALTIASRLVLAAVFLISASRKKYSGEEFMAAMKAFGVPAPRLSASVVTAVELALALTLMFWAKEAWPSVLAIVVLAAFTAVVAVKLRRGEAVPCPCFGASDRPISSGTLIRNGWLAALAVLGTGSASTADGVGIAVCGAILGVATAAVILRTS